MAGLHRVHSSSGLNHITGMKVGSVVPQHLQDLKYQLVFIELHEDDRSRGVHSLAVQCVNENEDAVLVVVGYSTVVSKGVMDLMETSMTCSAILHQVLGDVTFGEDSAGAADVVELCIICRKLLPWHVCSPLFLFISSSSPYGCELLVN